MELESLRLERLEREMVERDDLVDDSSDGWCEVEDGPALPAETARRLAGLLSSEGLLRLGWAGSTPEELRRGSAEPEAAGSKVLT